MDEENIEEIVGDQPSCGTDDLITGSMNRLREPGHWGSGFVRQDETSVDIRRALETAQNLHLITTMFKIKGSKLFLVKDVTWQIKLLG